MNQDKPAMKIITRAEATAQGLTRYYTGKPCKHGHLSERQRTSGMCLECHKLYGQTEQRKESNRKKQQRHYQRTQQRIKQAQAQQLDSQQVISREDARAQGLKKFFTGELCRNGHQGERHVSTAQCVECCKGKNARQHQRSQGIETDKPSVVLKIISREDAQAQGLKRYYAGDSCLHGHQAERYTNSGHCVECQRIKNSNHHKRNPHHGPTKFTAEAYPNAIIPLTPEEREALANVYRTAYGLTQWSGIKHQVDHCYPLARGGVHHPDNLIVVPATVNRTKGNSVDPTLPSVFHGALVSFSCMVQGCQPKQGRSPLLIVSLI